MQNGKFPTESLGEAEKQNFFNFGVKGGLTYKITGRHFIVGNAMYLTRAPYFRDSYISPRTRNHVLSGLINEKIVGGDIGYVLRAPKYKRGQHYIILSLKIRSIQEVLSRNPAKFVNYQMTGVDTKVWERNWS